MTNDIFQIIIILLLGLGFIIFSSFQSTKNKRILENGIEAEGIVFDFSKNSFNNNLDISNNLQYPIIRFLTKEKKWITEKPSLSLSSAFYKKGQSVVVIYNPENPTEFLIKSKIKSGVLINIFLFAGIILLLSGIYLAYNYLKK